MWFISVERSKTNGLAQNEATESNFINKDEEDEMVCILSILISVLFQNGKSKF